MTDLLFNVPWWIPTVLVIVGIAFLVHGNRRQDPRLRTAGMGFVFLAIAWALVSYFVDTPRKICQRQTRQLVQAVVDRNWATFDRLLAPDASFQLDDAAFAVEGADAMGRLVKSNVDQVGLKSASITSIQAVAARADEIAVTIHVWSNQDITLDRPIDSDWNTDWRLIGGQWKLHEMHGQVHDVSPGQVRGAIKHP